MSSKQEERRHASEIVHRVYRCVSRTTRRERLGIFYKQFQIHADTKILDVGGSELFWQLADALGLPVPRVTVVNLVFPYPGAAQEFPDWVVGDARQLPFPGSSFDVAFSNSVIEHLGTWDSQKMMAAEIRRVAKAYFVQTPDPRFPIEQHYLTPFIHWLPEGLTKSVARVASVRALLGDRGECRELVRTLRLLTEAKMRFLFPDASITTEKWCGIPKSIVAYRRQECEP